MTRTLMLALLASLAVADAAPAQVSVRGYYRNGHYVRGHSRTHPDGIISNNYSYNGYSSLLPLDRPNVSGPSGSTRTGPSSNRLSQKPRTNGSSTRRLGSGGELRDSASKSITQQSQPTAVLLTQIPDDLRRSVANRIASFGIDIDWQQYDVFQLTDIEARVRKASRIAELGVLVDWQSYSNSELAEIEDRVRTADRIKKLGHAVDWQQYSISALSKIENNLRYGR
jgi:hypothetical protein